MNIFIEDRAVRMRFCNKGLVYVLNWTLAVFYENNILYLLLLMKVKVMTYI